MSDNGSCYRSKDFRDACASHGLKHVRSRPLTPKTNGKAEPFIQTALREWALPKPTKVPTIAPTSCLAGYAATIGTGLMVA